jgi:hypothetical protein
LAVQSVAALSRAKVVDGAALLKKFSNRFAARHQAEIEEIWRNYALAPEELRGIYKHS